MERTGIKISPWGDEIYARLAFYVVSSSSVARSSNGAGVRFMAGLCAVLKFFPFSLLKENVQCIQRVVRI